MHPRPADAVSAHPTRRLRGGFNRQTFIVVEEAGSYRANVTGGMGNRLAGGARLGERESRYRRLARVHRTRRERQELRLSHRLRKGNRLQGTADRHLEDPELETECDPCLFDEDIEEECN